MTGITYKEFGLRIGVSLRTIHRYINGESEPTVRMAQKIMEETNNRVKFEDWL